MVTRVAGVVLAREGSSYMVATPAGTVRAILRGRMKRDMPRVVVGDRVGLDPDAEGGTHGIVSVEPRNSLLERRDPLGRGERPIVANVDLVLVVSATASPEPLPHLIDRLLVIADVNELPAAVVLNKADLAPATGLAARFEAAGYTVFVTSVETGEGLDRLRAALAGRITVITGPSGVGKSSLANAVQPGLDLRVGAVSQRAGRGRQTTVGAVMVPLDIGGYLVDTPGFSEVGIWGVPLRELGRCFPDLVPYLGRCRFPDCLHRGEPGCAVQAAVEDGRIADDRYGSYLQLLLELESAPRDWE